MYIRIILKAQIMIRFWTMLHYTFYQNIYLIEGFCSTKEFTNFVNFCGCVLDSEDFREVCSWLIESNSLSIEMLEYLKKEGIIEKYKLNKLFIRASLLDKLSGNISDSLLDLIIQSQDSVVQEAFLNKQNVDITTLSLLSEKGINKKVRNMARKKLDKLTYSKNTNRM